MSTGPNRTAVRNATCPGCGDQDSVTFLEDVIGLLFECHYCGWLADEEDAAALGVTSLSQLP